MINIITLGFIALLIVTTLISIKNKTKMRFLFDRNSTDAIRGIAILMIVLSHIFQYAGASAFIIGGGGTRAIVGCFGEIGVAIFFFLSGYGNYLSLTKASLRKNVIFKTLNKVLRLIIAFVFSFIIVGASIMLFKKSPCFVDVSFDEMIAAFLKLQMIGTSTWYLKIQILLYLFTAIAFIAFPSKGRNSAIFILTIIYVVFAKYVGGLADYWWKTGLAYFMGSLFAEFCNPINDFVSRHKNMTILVCTFSVGAGYIWILTDLEYRTIPQLISFMLISAGLVLAGCIFGLKSKLLIQIGKASLAIYLTHIGFAYAILYKIINVNVQIILFLVLTAVSAMIVYLLDQKCMHLKTRGELV